MIGAVIVAHGRLAQEMLIAAERVAGKQEGVIALSNEGLSLQDLREALQEAMGKIGSDDGLFLFVDMLGGSPWRVGREMVSSKVGLLSGVNLSMLLSFFQKRGRYPFGELASILENDGRRGVRLEVGDSE